MVFSNKVDACGPGARGRRNRCKRPRDSPGAGPRSKTRRAVARRRVSARSSMQNKPRHCTAQHAPSCSMHAGADVHAPLALAFAVACLYCLCRLERDRSVALQYQSYVEVNVGVISSMSGSARSALIYACLAALSRQPAAAKLAARCVLPRLSGTRVRSTPTSRRSCMPAFRSVRHDFSRVHGSTPQLGAPLHAERAARGHSDFTSLICRGTCPVHDYCSKPKG